MESTIIYYLPSRTPLAGSRDEVSGTSSLLEAKRNLKQLLPKLSSMGTISTNTNYMINYQLGSTNPNTNQMDLAFIVFTDRSFTNNEIVQAYLSEIKTEFLHMYKDQLNAQVMPYQFMQFESFIMKTSRVYSDSRVNKDSTVNVLQDQLMDVKHIMNQNINDMLNRGEDLNSLRDLSYTLKSQSSKYKKMAKKINWDLLLQQYGLYALIGGILMFIMYFLF